MSWYITLLACGLFLIGIEIFVPGGILGIFGVAALVAAAIIGFNIFPLWAGWLSLLTILVLTGLALFIWMKYLPLSPIGKKLSLSRGIEKKDNDDTPWKPGMSGTALCELRPAGIAVIDGKRVDVIAAHGSFIEHDTAVEIVRVSGNRVYVKEV
jgi:membrane-bound serine protease (ClpP class)